MHVPFEVSVEIQYFGDEAFSYAIFVGLFRLYDRETPRIGESFVMPEGSAVWPSRSVQLKVTDVMRFPSLNLEDCNTSAHVTLLATSSSERYLKELYQFLDKADIRRQYWECSGYT